MTCRQSPRVPISMQAKTLAGQSARLFRPHDRPPSRALDSKHGRLVRLWRRPFPKALHICGSIDHFPRARYDAKLPMKELRKRRNVVRAVRRVPFRIPTRDLVLCDRTLGSEHQQDRYGAHLAPAMARSWYAPSVTILDPGSSPLLMMDLPPRVPAT